MNRRAFLATLLLAPAIARILKPAIQTNPIFTGKLGVWNGVTIFHDPIQGQTIDLELIDELAAKAKLASPAIKPVTIHDKDYYVVHLKPGNPFADWILEERRRAAIPRNF